MFDGFVSSSKTNSVRQLPEKRHFRKMSILFRFLQSKKIFKTHIIIFDSTAVRKAKIHYISRQVKKNILKILLVGYNLKNQILLNMSKLCQTQKSRTLQM